MRIITGKIKGLKLTSPKGMDVRPTSDRVKESVFNILGDKVIDSTVLDLFSGTGNLALECFSRGAQQVFCIDNSETSCKIISNNIAKAKAFDYVKIYRNDAFKSIDYFYNKDFLFDLIFCDPPYDKNFIKLIFSKIKKFNILQKSGTIIIEYSKYEKFDLPEEFVCVRKEKYGQTMVDFIRFKEYNEL